MFFYYRELTLFLDSFNRMFIMLLHCPSNRMYRFYFILANFVAIVIERFGRFHRILLPGMQFVAPFIDRPRYFSWRQTSISSYGTFYVQELYTYRVDLRENIFNFPSQEVYTKDTIILNVNSLMYYRIVDVKKALYEVDNLQEAIENVVQTQLKEVFGSMSFQECMTSQDQINR